MGKLIDLKIILAQIMVLLPSLLYATELVYTPVNPSFGGNPINGTYLLSNAAAQNDTKAPTKAEQTQIEKFNTSLNNQILSQLARKIVATSFGDYNDQLASGYYDFGDFTMQIDVATGDKISVSITDVMTGGITTIDVPYYK